MSFVLRVQGSILRVFKILGLGFRMQSWGLVMLAYTWRRRSRSRGRRSCRCSNTAIVPIVLLVLLLSLSLFSLLHHHLLDKHCFSRYYARNVFFSVVLLSL